MMHWIDGKLPYNINLIDNMNYSIEFLELEDNWKTLYCFGSI